MEVILQKNVLILTDGTLDKVKRKMLTAIKCQKNMKKQLIFYF